MDCVPWPIFSTISKLCISMIESDKIEDSIPKSDRMEYVFDVIPIEMISIL